MVKGILHPGDARRAVATGADAIGVSNHGGRQLDGTVAPLHVLPHIREALPDTPILLDGAIRRGTQAVKALALGADLVLVGRPFNYAAALGRQPGVDWAISILKGEITRTLAQVGLRRIDELSPDILLPRGPIPPGAIPSDGGQDASDQPADHL